MRRALLFSGQGSHKKGMGFNYFLDRTSPGFDVWTRIQNAVKEAHGLDVTSVIRDDPDAVDVEGRSLAVPGGVMKLTYIAQPAMVTFHQATFAAMRRPAPSFDFVAGHSLGEFSALTALGVLTPEQTSVFVYRRGRVMVRALEPVIARDPTDPMPLPLFAVSPARAGFTQLTPAPPSTSNAAAAATPASGEKPSASDADAIVLDFVKAISKGASQHFMSMLELVNHNCRGEQMVVAGDRISLAALGKCLDFQWRAIAMAELGVDSWDVPELASKALAESMEDLALGVPRDPNKPIREFHVPGSRKKSHKNTLGHPQYRTIDGGMTPLEEDISGLSRQGDGRSGLKKKSWFIPLELGVPFHSSALRSGVDHIVAELEQIVPSSDKIAALLNAESAPKWITNATGTVFNIESAQFRRELRDVVLGSNIGEDHHVGRATPKATEAMLAACDAGDARGMLIAACAIQLTRTVQWARTMDTLAEAGVSHTVEVSPTPTLSTFIKRSPPRVTGVIKQAACYPVDARSVEGWWPTPPSSV